MGESEEFSTILESRLPQGSRIRVYHVSTLPSACPPLFAPASRRSGEATTLESHFLAISQPRSGQTDPTQPEPDVLVLGIEVLIFTTSNLTTVFVSKADSTGLLTRTSTAASCRTSLAQTVITAFLESLLTPRLNRSRLVLSLFARSQNQYLFPGSIENVTKHVLDDRQLIKWWCKALDPIARQARGRGPQTVKAHVVVPGCDSSETKAFFPSPNVAASTSDVTWTNTYPANLLVPDTSLPPRCLVPRLPDDPKSRFLDDLDAHADESGVWRGIKTLDQFWEMMSYRQECSAGRLVGFVWIVFTPSEALDGIDGAEHDKVVTQRPHQVEQPGDHQPVPPLGVAPGSVLDPCLTDISQSRASTATHGKSSRDGAVSVMAPSVPLETSTTAATDVSTGQSNKDAATTNGHYRPDANSIQTTSKNVTDETVMQQELKIPCRMLLSADHYQDLMDELLLLDFAGEDTAIENTRKWRDKAMDLTGTAHFGVDVEGIAVLSDASAAAAAAAAVETEPTINMLTGMRKKRKNESVDTSADSKTSKTPTINALASNLVRKKPKPSRDSLP